jgi:hypothetical protein
MLFSTKASSLSSGSGTAATVRTVNPSMGDNPRSRAPGAGCSGGSTMQTRDMIAGWCHYKAILPASSCRRLYSAHVLDWNEATRDSYQPRWLWTVECGLKTGLHGSMGKTG